MVKKTYILPEIIVMEMAEDSVLATSGNTVDTVSVSVSNDASVIDADVKSRPLIDFEFDDSL